MNEKKMYGPELVIEDYKDFYLRKFKREALYCKEIFLTYSFNNIFSSYILL